MNGKKKIFRVAICEDDRALADEAKQVLVAELETNGLKPESYLLAVFHTGEALLNTDVVWDLVVLDIDLGSGLDGIEVGHALKARSTSTMIVYLTNRDDLRDDGYEVGNFWYLEKKAGFATFRRAIKKAVTHLPDDEEWVSFYLMDEAHTKKSVSVLTDEIIYIETKGGRSLVKTRDGSFQTGLSLKEWEQKLRSDRFMRCHRSYIVNLDYATPITRSELVYNLDLRVGQLAISVSKKNVRKLNQKLHERVRKKGGI